MKSDNDFHCDINISLLFNYYVLFFVFLLFLIYMFYSYYFVQFYYVLIINTPYSLLLIKNNNFSLLSCLILFRSLLEVQFLQWYNFYTLELSVYFYLVCSEYIHF